MGEIWGKKKVKLLINNNLTFLFVTSEVEKSNFYRDLEQVIEWEDSTINISKNSISPRKL